MDKLTVICENKNYIEFDNGIFFDVENGCLTNKKPHLISVTDKKLADIKNSYREPIPQLELPLTHRCNLSCSYCTFRDRIKHKTYESLDMSWEIIESAISKYCEYLKSNHIKYGRIDFGVTGEPYLRKDIFPQVFALVEDYCKDLHVRKICAGPYISNATLPTSVDYIESFCSLQDISCDGPPKIHDSMRMYENGKGSFDDLINTLASLNGEKPQFGVSTVITAKNLDLISIFDYLHKNLQFGSIYMKPVNLKHDISYSLNAHNLEAFKNAYSLLIDWLMSREPNEILECILAFNKEDFFMRFFYRIKDRSKQMYRCGCGKSGIYVDVDGKIYPCAHFIGYEKYSIGDLEKGISSIAKDTYMSLTVDSRIICNECWARYLCGGGCYYQAALVNDSIDKPDLVKCALIKHLIIEAARLFLFLENNVPDVLAALPTPYFIRECDIDADPNSEYIPQAQFVLAESKSYFQVLSRKSIKKTLLKNIPRLKLAVEVFDGEIIFYFDTENGTKFDMSLWLCNLDEYKLYKSDLYNLNIFPYGDTIKIDSNGVVIQANDDGKLLKKIPFEHCEYLPCDSVKMFYVESTMEVHCNLLKLYDVVPSKIGVNITFNVKEGYSNMVTYEPYCTLNPNKNGYYMLRGGEFDEDAYTQLSPFCMDEVKDMIPIVRWNGMVPNVC